MSCLIAGHFPARHTCSRFKITLSSRALLNILMSKKAVEIEHNTQVNNTSSAWAARNLCGHAGASQALRCTANEQKS